MNYRQLLSRIPLFSNLNTYTTKILTVRFTGVKPRELCMTNASRKTLFKELQPRKFVNGKVVELTARRIRNKIHNQQNVSIYESLSRKFWFPYPRQQNRSRVMCLLLVDSATSVDISSTNKHSIATNLMCLFVLSLCVC